MSKEPDPLMARVTARLAKNARRSPLSVWMEENLETFAASLKKHGADWLGLAEEFAADGKLRVGPDFHSEDPTARAVARARAAKTAKTTYERAQKKAAAGSKGKASAPISRAPSPPPSVSPTPDQEPPTRPKFGPSKPKG